MEEIWSFGGWCNCPFKGKFKEKWRRLKSRNNGGTLNSRKNAEFVREETMEKSEVSGGDGIVVGIYMEKEKKWVGGRFLRQKINRQHLYCIDY